MIEFETGLLVRIEELSGDRAPRPLPLASGFSTGRAYRVLGLHMPSETSECHLMFANDRDELWFLSNRHLRAVGLATTGRQLRVELPRRRTAIGPRQARGLPGRERRKALSAPDVGVNRTAN